MSNLEELIERLCPDGVEYKKIGEIGTLTRGKRFVHADAVEDNGIPCIHYGELYTYYGVTTYDIKSQVKKELANKLRYASKNDVVIVGAGENAEDIGIAVAYLGESEIAVHDACYIWKHHENPKYLSYCLRTRNYHEQLKKYVSSGKICSVSATGISKIQLPVPPLEVQREIVRILDNFTFLTTELAAELAARQKQYEYFRDLLLNDCNGTNGKIIDMLVQPITDGPHTTPTLVSSGIPFVSAEAIFDGHVNFEKKRGFITEKFHLECCRKYKPQKNDVYLVKSGSTTGKVAYVYTDEEFNIWSPIAALRTNADNSSRFLFHLLQSNKIQQQVKSKSSHGSQPNLSMRVLEQFDVVIPSLEKQNQIANLLDRFDVLCNDISSGLPAEIEMRQKQYEYYRDKLLSFKELKKEA